MSGVNKIILIGRLGKKPEVKQAGGRPVSNFSLATSEFYRDRTTGERKEKVEWLEITAWSGLAQVCSKYFEKGDKVYLEGKLSTRTYKKGDQVIHKTEVIAEKINRYSERKAAQQATA